MSFAAVHMLAFISSLKHQKRKRQRRPKHKINSHSQADSTHTVWLGIDRGETSNNNKK